MTTDRTPDEVADAAVLALLSVLLRAVDTTDPQTLAELATSAQAAVDAAQAHQTGADA